MSDACFGNKTFAIHQRRYLGSKTKLLDFIEDILEEESIVFSTFADIFAGTGTVANRFFGKSNIIINDILDSNVQAYNAFFGRQELDENKLKERLVFYNNFDTDLYKGNYFSKNFSNTYFDGVNARRIGVIREDIEELYENSLINEREKSYLITSLIYALDKIANTVGHYDAYRKVTLPEKQLKLLPLQLTKSKYTVEIYKRDANELVQSIVSDVVYIDPPYNSRQYSDAYHLLENIVNWKKEPVFGVAKKINRSHIKSRYSMKSAAIAFSDLIDNINAKYILVSYNDMGLFGNARSQSRISDHEILSALKRKGSVKVFEKSFKQFTTGKSSKGDLKERIFLCKVNGHLNDSESVVASQRNPVHNGFVKSPLNYTGGKHKLLPQIVKFFPENIDTFYDIFAGGANVGINANAKKVVCIEKNEHVVNLLKLIQDRNFEDLNNSIIETVERFGLSQSYTKGYSFYNSESSKGLGQRNKKYFLKLREAFNNDKRQIELLLVLILYSFNNQIRFNSRGEYNLPVGKRDYNGSTRRNIASFNHASNEKKIVFKTCDFRKIEKMSLTKNDFVYLDPPYFLGLASYNESNGWVEKDERDLYALLTKLNMKGVRFALSNVLQHKGSMNNIMIDWVKKHQFKVNKLDHHYKNSNFQSKAKDNVTIEVLITNY